MPVLVEQFVVVRGKPKRCVNQSHVALSRGATVQFG